MTIVAVILVMVMVMVLIGSIYHITIHQYFDNEGDGGQLCRGDAALTRAPAMNMEMDLNPTSRLK